jgi:hypothetical protein
MPVKKDLAALLSETPQQPLRRGRGLRLSRASKQARELALKPSVLPDPLVSPEPSATVALPASEPLAALSIAPDTMADQADAVAELIEPAVLADPEPPQPKRDKRKLLLRKDLVKQCKRIARAQDRKLYQVIESALEDYIRRQGATE